MHLPFVDVAQAPVVESVADQIGDTAWRVGIVALGTGEAGMEKADVHASGHGALELR